MTIYNHSNVGTQPGMAALQGAFEALGQPELETAKPLTLYAETTWLRVDAKARETLCRYKARKIKEWTGKNLYKIFTGEQNRITIRDARIINSNANAKVFNITAKNVVEFTVDQNIRDRLKSINFQEVQTDLKKIRETQTAFDLLKLESRSINTERAEDYNNFINPELFDKERVFNLACNEPIFEKTPPGPFIRIESEHRQKLKALSQECKQKLVNVIGRNFRNYVNNNTQNISIEHAELIHKISGQTIFDLEKVKGAPDLPPSQGTKRPLAVSPADPSVLPSKRQRNDVDDVDALAFTNSIPQTRVFTNEVQPPELSWPQVFNGLFNARTTLYTEFESPPQFTPPSETNRSVNSSAEHNSLDFGVGDDLYDVAQFLSMNSSSTATSALSIQKISPFPFTYDV